MTDENWICSGLRQGGLYRAAQYGKKCSACKPCTWACMQQRDERLVCVGEDSGRGFPPALALCAGIEVELSGRAIFCAGYINSL